MPLVVKLVELCWLKETVSINHENLFLNYFPSASNVQIKVHLEHQEDPGNVEGYEGALHEVEKNKEDKVCQLGKK